MKHKLYILNLLFMCYLSRNLTFLIINVYYTLILTLDFVEEWFSSTSDIRIKQNFALTLDINTFWLENTSCFKRHNYFYSKIYWSSEIPRFIWSWVWPCHWVLTIEIWVEIACITWSQRALCYNKKYIFDFYPQFLTEVLNPLECPTW